MARPTKYTPELLERAKEYLVEAQTEERIPSIEGFSFYLGIHKDTAYDWASQEDKQEFSDVLRKVVMLQGEQLIQNGLQGKWNPTIAKLILTKHGYSDKQDITSGGEKLPQPILGGTSVQSSNSNNEDTETTEQD